MIDLYQFHPALGLPNPSPFCMKVETFLRMTKLEYRLHNNADVRKAPKKKLPFIKDGEALIPDSGFILQYLKTKYELSIDDHLSPAQQATGVALTRLLEDHLYWIVVSDRWLDDTTWLKLKKLFFASLPSFLRYFVPELIRKKIRRDLYGQGLGRHSQDELRQLAQEDIKAVADILSDNDYLFGDTPCSYDAVIYSFIGNAFFCTLDSPMKEIIRRHDNLVQYCERMKNCYYNS